MRNSPPATDRSTRPRTSWGRIGARLIAEEQRDARGNDSGSVAEWIAEKSREYGVSPQSLWRYRSAAKFYNEQRALHQRKGVRLPALEDVAPTVSAEAIELLSKMIRIVPVDVLEPMERRILEGTIKKKEVQAAWAAYAPLLQGRSARGRGVQVESIALDEASRRSADIVLGLRRSRGSWLGRRLAMYEVFAASDLCGNEVESPILEHAVVVSRDSQDDGVQLHGVVIGATDHSVPEAKSFRTLGNAVDRIWFASTASLTERQIEPLPDRMGVLHVDVGGGVRVMREAQAISHTRSASEALARQVLSRLRGV